MKRVVLFCCMFFLGINLVYANEMVEFVKCVDGDTFRVIINDTEHLVRMIAIDTPELAKNENKAEYYANEASNYTCNKLKNAKKIELEYDNNSDKVDKYDRILAWVYVDGKLLQEDLVRNGYAKVAYLYDDYKYTEILKEKQELSSAEGIGIWNSDKEKEYNDNLQDDSTYSEEVGNGVVGLVGIVILVIVFLIDKMVNSKK